MKFNASLTFGIIKGKTRNGTKPLFLSQSIISPWSNVIKTEFSSDFYMDLCYYKYQPIPIRCQECNRGLSRPNKMSFITKIVAFTLFTGAFALEGSALGIAPISLDLKPIGSAHLTRRQVAAANSESPLKFSLASGYTTPVKIGAGTYNLVVSTQETDTWVASDKIACPPPPKGAPADFRIPCVFGAKYPSGSFKRQEGLAFGEVGALGNVGTDSITVGGVTVPNQLFGLADTVPSNNDGQMSGVLGLGPANGTQMGTPKGSYLVYNPLFMNMIANNLINPPVFSLSLSNDGGALAFGGLPRSVNVDAGSWASAPLIDSFFAVKGNGYSAGGQNTQADLNLFINTRIPGSLLPKNIATVINKSLFGIDKFRTQDGMFQIECSLKAKANVGLVIGGKTFIFNAADLSSPDPMTQGKCVSSIKANLDPDSLENDAVLGVDFLKTVVIVYDPQNNRIQFAKKI